VTVGEDFFLCLLKYQDRELLYQTLEMLIGNIYCASQEKKVIDREEDEMIHLPPKSNNFEYMN